MDETTKSVISRITKRFNSPTEFAPGKVGNIFYDCIQLTPSELARLAAEATGHLPLDAFDMAVGISYSGILFAAAIAGGRNVAIVQADGKLWGPDVAKQKVLIVDDVIHSGSRVMQGKKLLEDAGANVAGFACIIDRTDTAADVLATKLPVWSAWQCSLDQA